MDCRHVALGRDSRTLLSVHLLDVVVAIIERSGEVSGGAARLAAADRPIINQDNGTACTRERVRGRHAGDACSHDADVGTQILCKRLKLWNFSGVHPDRGRVTRVALHRGSRALNGVSRADLETRNGAYDMPCATLESCPFLQQ